MATRRKATRAPALAPDPIPEHKPKPQHCADCRWFDYQTSRQGICRLRPPFIQVHPTDRCSFFELAEVRPQLA